MKQDSDGLHIHQSDLNGHCLEQLRRDTVAVGPRQETDAATVGTALHVAIEDELNNGFWGNEEELVHFGIHAFINLLEGYALEGKPYVMSSYTPEEAVRMLDSIIRSWFRSSERRMLETHDKADRLVEWHFDMPFMECEVQRTPRSKKEVIPIWLAGTADLLLLDKGRIWDWKSAASPYKRWEKQRWGVQAPVYTWAAHEAGLIPLNKQGVIDFDFKVFLKRAKPAGCETVTVQAGPGNWSWLAHRVFNLVNMKYQMGLDTPWPLDDGHVLCSPKWCGHWDACKGAHVSGESWT